MVYIHTLYRETVNIYHCMSRVGHVTTVSRCIAPIYYQRPRSYIGYTPYNRGSYNIYYSIRTAVFRSNFSRAARYRSVSISASASRVRTVAGSSLVLWRVEK